MDMDPSDDTTTATSAAPDRASEAATDAAAETLLNCYLREGGVWRPVPADDVPELAEDGDEYLAVMPFPGERTMLLAGIRHLSPTHRHRFRLPVRVAMAGGAPWPVSLELAIQKALRAACLKRYGSGTKYAQSRKLRGLFQKAGLTPHVPRPHRGLRSLTSAIPPASARNGCRRRC